MTAPAAPLPGAPPIDLLRCALPAPDTLASEASEASAAIQRPFLRAAAAAALAEARADPAWATPRLAAHFRAQKKLGSHDRKHVQRAVFGVIRHEALLRAAGLGPGLPELEGWAALLGGERFSGVQAASPEAAYALALSLPEAIAAEWLAALGPTEAAAFAQRQTERAPITLRANRGRCDRAALAARLAAEGLHTRPVPGLPDALELEGAANLQPLASARAGWFEVQDRSSQAFVAAIAAHRPLAGLRVLDLCAGAGGKSLALAALGAEVWADDPRPAALRELQRRAARAGAAVALGRPRARPAVVVVDAPCSGTGRLQREPALRYKLAVEPLLPVQAGLLAEAARLVAPGGLVAYATCSLMRAENAPPTPPGLRWAGGALRWPHREGGDGFGWALYEAEG